MKKNLIICVAGDRSLHQEWLKGESPQFDLMVIYCGDQKGRYDGDGQYYNHSTGLFKLENLSEALKASSALIGKYEAVFLPDDDFLMDAKKINRLFEIFHHHQLDVAQPAIAGGVISHELTKQDLSCFMRYVNFVEMACPIFKTALLFEIKDLLTLTRSGWGIDWAWSQKLKDKKLAIIDEIGVFHKKRRWSFQRLMCEGQYYKQLAVRGIDAWKEQRDLAKGKQLSLSDYQIYEKLKKKLIIRLFLNPLGWLRVFLTHIQRFKIIEPL